MLLAVVRRLSSRHVCVVGVSPDTIFALFAQPI